MDAAGALQPLQTTTVIVAPAEETRLSVDAVQKSYAAKPGEESCVFTFAVKNTSEVDLIINQVRTTCGCTIAKLPSQPWRLAPGEGGDITLTVDLRGKTGTLIKSATIDLASGYKQLTIAVDIPVDASPAGASRRELNMQLAAQNRQAVFKGECATCHVAPAVGQMGVGLYVTACSICHDAEPRASMVPDLHTVKQSADRNYWKLMIAEGKPNTLMPAFDRRHGGPLSAEQIDSLVEYLAGEFSGHSQ